MFKKGLKSSISWNEAKVEEWFYYLLIFKSNQLLFLVRQIKPPRIIYKLDNTLFGLCSVQTLALKPPCLLPVRKDFIKNVSLIKQTLSHLLSANIVRDQWTLSALLFFDLSVFLSSFAIFIRNNPAA